jgi:hypothetical protein
MMPQMEANQPIHEQPSNAYGAYGGNRESTQQRYEAPYQQPPPQAGTLDNNFVEAVSQRIAQLMSQQSTSKAYIPKSQDKPPHGMQLALGIVSVIILLPLAGICLTGMESIGGLIGFLIGCSAIICINLAFNGVLDSRRRGGIVK